MRLSEKKQSELFESIHEPITKLRLDISRVGSPSSEVLDQLLFDLSLDIHKEVKKTLNIKREDK